MAKSVSHALRNTFFQAFGSFGVTTLNFLLMLGYARILGPGRLGELSTSQAHVLVWLAFVDLGLSNALIGALTAAESDRGDPSRQGFRSRDIVSRVIALRFLGAVLGALGIASLAYFRSRDGGVLNRDLFFQEIAFVPQLFALVFQHTAISFATYQRRQGLGQASMIIATSFSVAIPLYLASQGASIATLLFSQSWGGFISTIIVYLVLKWDREPVVSTRREKTKFIISGGPWGLEAWKALARDAWPYASVYAAITLWQRLDQIVTSEFLGFEAAGQYALAVRLAAIPMLIATSVGHALFPDLQRVGRDAPEKVSIYIGALVKLVFRWGLIAIACILAAAFFFIAPLVPKFKPAFDLLPWFLPGIWAYWMHSFVVGGLFGLRRYKAVVKAHALALIGYLMVLLPSAYYFGLAGVVVGSNSFSIFLFLGALYVAKRTQALPGNFSIAAPFSDDETALIGKIHHRFNRAPKSGVSQG